MFQSIGRFRDPEVRVRRLIVAVVAWATVLCVGWLVAWVAGLALLVRVLRWLALWFWTLLFAHAPAPRLLLEPSPPEIPMAVTVVEVEMGDLDAQWEEEPRIDESDLTEAMARWEAEERGREGERPHETVADERISGGVLVALGSSDHARISDLLTEGGIVGGLGTDSGAFAASSAVSGTSWGVWLESTVDGDQPDAHWTLDGARRGVRQCISVARPTVVPTLHAVITLPGDGTVDVDVTGSADASVITCVERRLGQEAWDLSSGPATIRATFGATPI